MDDPLEGVALEATGIDEQLPLFEAEVIPKGWELEWQGMPEFRIANCKPVQQITLNFRSYEDARRFGELIRRKITRQTDSLWFPFSEPCVAPKTVRYMDEEDESAISDLHPIQGAVEKPPHL